MPVAVLPKLSVTVRVCVVDAAATVAFPLSTPVLLNSNPFGNAGETPSVRGSSPPTEVAIAVEFDTVVFLDSSTVALSIVNVSTGSSVTSVNVTESSCGVVNESVTLIV